MAPTKPLALAIVSVLAVRSAGVSSSQRAPVALSSSVPPAVARLLAQARERLSGPRNIATVSRLELAGTETTLRDTVARESAYAVTLAPPDTLELRMGPVLHVLARGVYSRRLVDTTRFGGPMLDRLMADPKTMKAAANGMHGHLIRLSLTYLARAPSAPVVEDEGVKDFGAIKGRTIAFKDPAERAQSELVVDPMTFDPLGVVTPVHMFGGASDGWEGNWVSIPGDYREVGGVRIPHRIEDWIGLTHVRVVLTSVKVQ